MQNNYKGWKHGLQRKMNFFILVIVAVTPFMYFPNVISYSSLPKFLFLLLLTIVIAITMLLRKSKETYPVYREDKLLILYLLFLILSTIFSHNHLYSLIGYSTRFEGLITLIIYIFVFFLAYRNFEFNEKFFRIFIITTILLSLYGVFQYFGFDPMPKEVARVIFVGRGHSTFGNPNFHGTYLTLVLPIAAYVYLKSGKVLYFIAAGSIYFSLITSFTRSGWVGSFFAFGIILYYSFKTKFNKKYIVYLLVLLLVITVAMEIESEGRVILRALSLVEEAGDVLTQADGYEEGGANRIFIWERVIPLIFERPLVGFGPETLGEVFSERYHDDIIAKYGEERIFDKAHNEYLHVAVTTGIPSLFVYLAFVFSILKRAYMNRHKNPMIIPLMASIIGYLIQAFFNLSIITVAYIYWVFLGILLRLSLDAEDREIA
jgi:putative inorganic carbon (HCO3(-)) transporter